MQMYLLISSGWWFSVTLKMICRTYKVFISYKLHIIKLHAHTKTNSKMLYVAEDKAIIQVYQKEMPFHISKYKVRHLGAKHVNFHCSVVIKKGEHGQTLDVWAEDLQGRTGTQQSYAVMRRLQWADVSESIRTLEKDAERLEKFGKELQTWFEV